MDKNSATLPQYTEYPEAFYRGMYSASIDSLVEGRCRGWRLATLCVLSLSRNAFLRHTSTKSAREDAVFSTSFSLIVWPYILILVAQRPGDDWWYGHCGKNFLRGRVQCVDGKMEIWGCMRYVLHPDAQSAWARTWSLVVRSHRCATFCTKSRLVILWEDKLE